MDKSIREKQVFIGSKPNPKNMEKVSSRYQMKPDKGLWTSDYDRNKISSWIQWIYNNDRLKWYDNDKVWLLTPMKNKVFKIQDIEDIKYLKNNYPTKHNDTHTKYKKLDPQLDYSKISNEYHGVSMRMNPRVGLKIHWDVESTVWFNWRFTKVEKIGELKDLIENKFGRK